jgi:hypothetical protein
MTLIGRILADQMKAGSFRMTLIGRSLADQMKAGSFERFEDLQG